jgi:GTP-binding protein Era
MVAEAEGAVPDADVVVFLVDLSAAPDGDDHRVAALVNRFVNVPAFLAMNKVDLLEDEAQLAARRAAYTALGQFDAEAVISAERGTGTDALLGDVVARLPRGPRFYPPDQLVDQSERWVAAELIREQVLINLRHEVPHAVAVVVDEFIERPNGVLYIGASIYTEQDSQKGIVIGARGNMLKQIGSAARTALEEFFDRRVYVDLWVKVRPNWRTNERYLKQLGYG